MSGGHPLNAVVRVSETRCNFIRVFCFVLDGINLNLGGRSKGGRLVLFILLGELLPCHISNNLILVVQYKDETMHVLVAMKHMLGLGNDFFFISVRFEGCHTLSRS